MSFQRQQRIVTEPLEAYVRFFLHRSGVRRCRDFGHASDEMFADPRIEEILTELEGWPGRELANHKNASHPLHLLSFIAELGMNIRSPEIGSIVRSVMANQSAEGPFEVLINIGERYGGQGWPVMSWMLCDAAPLTYALIRLNGKIDAEIRRSVDFIAGLVSANGWRCTVSPDLDGFRGPGKKSDPCPYATLWSLRMLSETPTQMYQEAKEIGIHTLLELWRRRREVRPYLFAMGTDFQKLKLPFVWYDILSVADTLSRFESARSQRALQEMTGIIRGKRTPAGFIPESVYRSAFQWDFGQKRAPSAFMTAVVDRIEKRMNE